MRLNKILSIVMASVMSFSCVIPTFAEESVQNSAATVWNSQLIDESAIPTYESFPVRIIKTITQEMKMDLSFQYLKNIGIDDVVEVAIINQADNSTMLSKSLATDSIDFALVDVPNDQYYQITVSETIDGEHNSYIGYIHTEHTATDFPVSMSLGNNVISAEIDAEWENVLIKKVGERPVCNHGDDEECTDACSLSSCIDVLDQADMDSFYNTLDSNCYYEIQVTASAENVSELYRGYISTYPGGEYQGVFTRGYSFSTEPISSYGISMASAEFDPNFTTPIEYELYRNINISQAGSATVATIKFIPPQTGYYTIETIGNANLMFEVYSEDNGIMREGYDLVRDGGTGENPSYSFGVLVNNDPDEGTLYRPVKYIVVGLEYGEAQAPYSFRIIRDIDGESDDVTNYLDEVKAQCDLGTYAQPTNEKRMNYYGDVDAYGYKSTATGNGYFRITSQGAATDADVFTITQDGDGNEMLWNAGTKTSTSSNDANATWTFEKGRYYVEVHQNTNTLPEYDINSNEYYQDPVYRYTLDFYHPAQKDAVDLATHATYGNSTPVYVTDITIPYSNNTMTLGKGDSDYFRFTTGETGGDLSVKISGVTKSDQSVIMYIPELYDYDDVEIVATEPPEWYSLYTIADYTTITENGKQVNELTYSGLLPNHDYLICVDRPNSSTYDVFHPYTIEVSITEPQIPSAVFSGNVALSHTVGDTITNLSAIYAEVMQSLTCYINDTAIADSEALADVKLYHNGTELSVSMVNVMGAGSYTLIAKYRDVEATGGTITLTVSENVVSQDDVKTVTIANKISADEEFLDWAATVKMLVDTRLLREGLSATGGDAYDISDTYGEWEVRADMSTAIAAANAMYNAAKNTTDAPSTVFRTGSVNASNIMTTVYNQLNAGKPVVALLTDTANVSDMSLARYVIIVGVNRTQGIYQIIDPFENYTTVVDVSSDVFLNGGYLGRSTLKFSGRISEVN